MNLPSFRAPQYPNEEPFPAGYRPEPAVDVVEREARKTRIVIWAEEHHLPQTRSLLETLLRRLHLQGYRYFAAETFADSVMKPRLKYPVSGSGYYTRDPVFANAVRIASQLGYELIAYDTKERGPAGDASFRDRTQAENLKKRIFDRDKQAKVLIVAGRLHASEIVPPDGWTPMASVLKRITGIDPFTAFTPTMTQRQASAEEHPYYRAATAQGFVMEPTIFVDPMAGKTLGFEACDAYVFWPRVRVRGGRPDWLVTTLGRKVSTIPEALRAGTGLRLVQAFGQGEPNTAVPVDQTLLREGEDAPDLMLPVGTFRVRVIDAAGRSLGEVTVLVR